MERGVLLCRLVIAGRCWPQACPNWTSLPASHQLTDLAAWKLSHAAGSVYHHSRAYKPFTTLAALLTILLHSLRPGGPLGAFLP